MLTGESPQQGDSAGQGHPAATSAGHHLQYLQRSGALLQATRPPCKGWWVYNEALLDSVIEQAERSWAAAMVERSDMKALMDLCVQRLPVSC